MFSGAKTYIVAVGMVVYAVAGLVLNYIEPSEAWTIILEAIGLAALRAGVTKSGVS